MSRFCKIIALVSLFLITLQPGSSQKKLLTYKQVFERGEPRLIQSIPSPFAWLDDNYYLIRKRSDNKPVFMKVNALTGEESLYVDFSPYKKYLSEDFEMTGLPSHSADYTKFIFSKDNDLYLFNSLSNEFKQLTDNSTEEKNATFSPDENKIAFTRDNDIYVIDLITSLEIRLTDDGDELIYNGWASWVYYEEILGRSSRYRAFWWSPNSKMIAFLRFDDSPVPEFPLFRADGIHGELEKTRYPKPGDPNPLVKLGVIDLKSGKTAWLDDTQEYDHYTAWPFWSPDSKILVFQSLNRDQNDIRFLAADPFSGKIREIYHEHQDSWVDFFEDVYVFKDGSGFLLKSNKSGWRNLYYYSFDGDLISQVTPFDWQVNSVEQVNEKTKTVYFLGTGGISTETNLFSIKLSGKGLKKLNTVTGTHRTLFSKGGRLIYDIYSDIRTPEKHEIFNEAGKSIRFVNNSKLPVMYEYNLGKSELFTIPTKDGYDLPASWILPPDFDENKKYPVIINIYGGPESQEVANRYPMRLSSYYYAQNGIIVISFDHRGSGHFGKNGSNQMYRNLGKWEMNDYIEAVKWLKTKPFIDGDKIGITGGSYGGYTTCMALTYGADYFNYGIANYSVTDWKLYDNVYTERYMDTPDQNPEGYEFGSALTHADNYKGKLLITHGTMDDNVHMQNTIQLIDKLQDMGKDFEMMLYPGERHGWGGPKRDHFSKLTIKFWFKNLLEKEFLEEE
jgi:dipeptidyl-peptidase-4